MKPNNPIYADLSCYNPQETIPFYENVFGWKYYPEKDYYTAFIGSDPVVGLYETPEKFKQMRMPHFWMTYIQVNDANKTVENARELGGIIEMTEEIPSFGKVALIRDPRGAGFTIFEGYGLATRTDNLPNTLVWNELHVSEIDKVMPFYKGIFNWHFKDRSDGGVEIINHEKEHVANILEISNEMKGKHEYWISSFGVRNMQSTKTKIIENGGKLIFDEGFRMLFSDNNEQAFFYIIPV